MIDEQDKKYVYKSTLRMVYGLTDGMIQKLGEPDRLVKNPHHRSSTAYLYLIERVESWCEDHAVEVEKARLLRPARSARAKEQMTARRAALLEWATIVQIIINDWPDDIRAAAEAHYAARRDDYDYYDVTEGAVLAYARHNCTNYHELLSQLRGRWMPGADEAYTIIKDRVNEICSQRMKIATDN